MAMRWATRWAFPLMGWHLATLTGWLMVRRLAFPQTVTHSAFPPMDWHSVSLLTDCPMAYPHLVTH